MEFESIVTHVENRFRELYHSNPILIRAPGRINLIGEHTDYNDGFVLPAAIDKSIIFAIYPNNTNTFRFFSIDFNEAFDSDHIADKEEGPLWARYLFGVLDQYRQKGIYIEGVDCVFGGNIPIGSGLSSSAALECGFAFGLNELFDFGLSPIELVKMSQKAEHEYAGVMCGIMDQYASVFGRKEHVFRLDCRSITHEYFPIDQEDHLIVLCDTKVKHQLASSEYNKRRIECEKGVQILKKIYPTVKALRDVSPDMLEENQNLFDPLTYKRCLYVSEENERVINACKHLQHGDLNNFGNLMYASHEGLKNQYQVSCRELDYLVDLTKGLNYVYGSRLMGGGFGGCTINLIDRSELKRFKEEISTKYTRQFNLEPEFYLADICNGVHRIK